MTPWSRVRSESESHHVANMASAPCASRRTRRARSTKPTSARMAAVTKARAASARSAGSTSHQLLDAAGEAFLGLLDLHDEAALVRAARLALDLGAQRGLAVADARDGLAEEAEREVARRDARAGLVLQQVGAHEGEP